MAMIAERVAKKYRTRFIEPGLMNYGDLDVGVVLVQKSALDKMAPTFEGKPIVLDHIDPDTGKEFEAGVVSAAPFWEDGWQWVDMLIWDEDTKRRLDNEGYNVSCAYVPTSAGAAGIYHGLPYDSEILDGVYTHMAIVDNPRYEGALVFTNSKGKEKRMRLFRVAKDVPEAKVEKELKNAQAEIVNEGDGDEDVLENACVEMENGEQVPVSELISAYKRGKRQVMNADDEVDVDGERVKVSELMSAYMSKGSVKNEAIEPTAEVAEDVVDEAKQESHMTNAKPKKNENFKLVKNSVERAVRPEVSVDTRTDRLERGRTRYGKIVRNGGNS